jgi:hypothetical protein
MVDRDYLNTEVNFLNKHESVNGSHLDYVPM